MKVILAYNEMRRDGMGTAALTLYRALKSQGLQVVPIHAWDEINFPEYEKEAAPQIVRQGPRHDPITDDVKLLVERLNSVCNDGDVVIDSGSPNWLCTIPYLKPGIRWITCVHSINPSTLKLCRAYPDRVSAFVCISKGVMDRFLKKLPSRYHAKVHLICNAVAACDSPKNNYELNGPMRILYVGRIENTSKGCGKIPKILAELERRGVMATCDFYGYFHNWEDGFWKTVDAAGVRTRIRYCGEIAHEEIYRIMPQYDCFIAPSNFEGFPLSLSEAMMCALPVVTSNIKGVTDWICEDGASGMLCPKMDIRSFATAIEMLARMTSAERMQMGVAARKRIGDLASFDVHGKQYATLARTVGEMKGYVMVKPSCDLEHFEIPECLKPWCVARLLPKGVKTFLRRFM